MKAKKKRPNRRALIAKADRLVSRKVRARAVCELWLLNPDLRCKGDFQACHIIGRRFKSTRFDEENLLCGCQAHHLDFTYRPAAFFLAMEEVYPGRYARLWAQAQKPWDRDIEGVLERLTASEEAL